MVGIFVVILFCLFVCFDCFVWLVCSLWFGLVLFFHSQ